MAWRASYSLLIEIFPQVDTRILKGAALDHGEDLVSAADFILNEVLGPDDGNSDEEQHSLSTVERLPSEIVSRGPNTGDRLITDSVSDGECPSRISVTELAKDTNENLVSYGNDGSDGGQEVITDLAPNSSARNSFGVSSKEDDEAAALVSCGSSEVMSANVDFRTVDVRKIEAPTQFFPDVDLGGEHISRSNFGASSREEAHGAEDELLGESPRTADLVEVEKIVDDGRQNQFGIVCSSEAADLQGVLETEEKNEILDYVKVMPEITCEGSTYTDPQNSDMVNVVSRDCEELEEEMNRSSVYDSVLVSKSKIETETVVEEDGLEMMTSTKMTFDEEDETEGGCWETMSSISTQIVSMETLLDVVEQAKEDKEVLISTIEELRALRLKTDQAEYAANVAKDEAEKGGLEIMTQVVEMKQTLSRAREANEVHAAEVHGEKAVLATEARELRFRLVQLKKEKEKALSVLNEIKASLQARIDRACQERESAIAEKATKEAFARECLMKEEALMVMVAKESRELQAETETCNELREFLIERGNIVDALQGEVAVLCEDAEELKEEIERMSLSSSSGYVHMLKWRPLGDSSNSPLSRSSKSGVNGEGVSHSFEGVDQLDFPLDRDVAGSSPAKLLVGGQRNAMDKRLPSLRRALSGSQELSGSSHLSVNSMAGASNSAVSSRSVMKVSTDNGDRNRLSEDKYPSPPSSQCGSDAERRLYQAQIAIFPDEESDLLDYRASNLDIFRTENARTMKGASSDEDDWHLLDLTLGSKRTSSESSCSSCAGSNSQESRTGQKKCT